MAAQNFTDGITGIRAGESEAVWEITKNGDARLNSITLTGSGSTIATLLLPNNQFLCGLTSANAIKRLIGVNSSNGVSIDTDALGVLFGGNIALASNGSIDGTSSININGAAADVDVAVYSDASTPLIYANAGVFSGTGALGIGVDPGPSHGEFVRVDMPVMSGAASALPSMHVSVSPTAGSTITSGTKPRVASLYLNEPGFTVSGGGAITLAATLLINSAPTTGTTTAAIYVTNGAVSTPSATTRACAVADLAALPQVVGTRAFVTDSDAASFTAGIGAIVAAGGSTKVPVVFDGTNWRIG